MAYLRGTLPFGLKGRFYANIAFYPKGKILCQSFLYVLNGKILHRTNGVKPNSGDLNTTIHNGRILRQTLSLHNMVVENNCNSYVLTHFSLQLIKVYLVTMVTAEHIPRADPG